ncbi:MAG: MBL fold metallo-hydrolase [Bacteroidaceae bacterium]|nr:MBL fold metallo-hydrolase [Bacteroidaceae bacterium]
MVNVKIFIVNDNETNAILIWDETNQGLLVDPGFCSKEEFSNFVEFVSQKGIIISNIVLTHGHYDHVAGVNQCIQTFPAPVYLHKLEEDNARLGLSICRLNQWELCQDGTFFSSEDIASISDITVGNQVYQIIHTPGHSSGSICMYCKANKLLLSGDTIFRHNYGRTDLDGGDLNALRGSFAKLVLLPDETYVIAGHGQPTTIGEEKNNNPLNAVL